MTGTTDDFSVSFHPPYDLEKNRPVKLFNKVFGLPKVLLKIYTKKIPCQGGRVSNAHGGR
jgi:hypothetical protein